MILQNVSDEFIDWLDECPVQWHLIQQKDNSLIYEFEKSKEYEEEVE